jgi:hypothetical protein
MRNIRISAALAVRTLATAVVAVVALTASARADYISPRAMFHPTVNYHDYRDYDRRRARGGRYKQPRQSAYYYRSPSQATYYRGVSKQRVMRSSAGAASGGAAVAARPMPPLQPQVPPPGMQSSPGAIPVNTAQPIRYTGPMGSCTRSDGALGRAGLSPAGRAACYRF